jgi:HEAT repeat protein
MAEASLSRIQLPHGIVKVGSTKSPRFIFAAGVVCLFFCFSIICDGQAGDSSAPISPFQKELELQRSRLKSDDREVRRDAVLCLGRLKKAESSGLAVTALNDTDASVRASATHAILSLPADEAARALIPLLADKSDFVRQEAAYALGRTRSKEATVALVDSLKFDKTAGVRAAAALSLGFIGDRSATDALLAVVSGKSESEGKRKGKAERNDLVLRSSVRSLGLIHDPKAVPELERILGDQNTASDIRRESAIALGEIKDKSALQSLTAALTTADPYLAKAARDAIRRIQQE